MSFNPDHQRRIKLYKLKQATSKRLDDAVIRSIIDLKLSIIVMKG